MIALLSTVSAVLSAFGSMGTLWLPLVFVQLLPLLIALRFCKRPFWTAFFWAFVYFGTLLHWMPAVFVRSPEISSAWLGYPSTLGLCALLAILYGLWGLRAHTALQTRTLGMSFELPALWVLIEVVRNYALTGFPWMNLGYGLLDVPLLAPLLRIGGIYMLDFILVYTSVLAFILSVRAPSWRWVLSLGTGLLLLALGAGYGYWLHRIPAEGRPLQARLVQANIDQQQKWDEAHAQQVLSRHMRLSLSGDPAIPDILVWPESALPFFWNGDTGSAVQLGAFLNALDVELLTGAIRVETSEAGPRYYNSSVLTDGELRALGTYDKQHLVPFGEYIPMRSMLDFAVRLVPGEDYRPGQSSQPLTSARGDRYGLLICYESIFSPLVARIGRDAEVLVNLTNDVWIGGGWGARQHERMSRARAVENGRFLLRASNSGISGAYDYLGRPIGRLAYAEQGYLDAQVLLLHEPTPYSLFPMGFPALCLATGALLIWRRPPEIRRRVKL